MPRSLRLALLLLLSALGLSGCVDADGDGYIAIEDCDDTDAEIHPGAQERCDGRDGDCNGVLPDEEADLDGDGVSWCDGDCNDADRHTYVDAPELCDGVDNDCDGALDEDFEDTNDDGTVDCLEADADGDGLRPSDGDCDDDDPDTYTGAPELCDGVDNDCDGAANADPLGEADRDGDGSLSCADCDDADPANFPGNQEVCDEQDNDCDELEDEGVLPTWYFDADEDGYGRTDQAVRSCTPLAGYSLNGGDCADDDPFRSPGIVEVCDQIDNDCDGFVDDGVLSTWYRDVDGDGFGADSGSEDAVVWDCSRPPGYASSSTDCHDDVASVFPGAPEVCDRLDSNCDGFIPPEEIDGDGDDQTICEGDCDDTVGTIYDGATESCNLVDDDCSGVADDASGNVLCPPPPNVATTNCLATPACEIVQCNAGFFAIDADYGNGCECADDEAGPTCITAKDLGGFSPGQSTTYTGKLPLAGMSDWIHVAFPTGSRPGGGFPNIVLSTNPGNAYAFDVYLTCGGQAADCGVGPAVARTSYDFVDNGSSGLNQYTLNNIAWPKNLYLRVYRTTSGNNCDDYVLSVSR